MRSFLSGKSPSMSAEAAECLSGKKSDANILRVALGSIESAGPLATGDPFSCPCCHSYFSCGSSANVAKSETGAPIWTCEFCGTRTPVSLEPPEFPTTNCVTYLLNQLSDGTKLQPEEEQKAKVPNKHVLAGPEPTVVFCVDCSGSMDDTTDMKVCHGMKYLRSPNSVSRLEAVKLAIDSQLRQLSRSAPGRKVGFVTFESAVQILGDGSHPPVKLPKALHNNFDGNIAFAEKLNDEYLARPLRETCEMLLERLEHICTGGCTTLGPALAAAVAMASKGAPGSRVIICTDGIANEGMGEIEGHETKAKEFYTRLGKYAKERGVIVSIISIVSSECRLEMLSPVADMTGGDVLRVDPENLSNDFETLLSEKVIATNVTVKVRLHRALRFVGVPESYLSPDGSVYTQPIGSANRDTSVVCKYSMKSIKDLERMKGIDYFRMMQVPIQAQIEFRDLEGKNCVTVFTKLAECTEELSLSKRGMNKRIVTTCCARSAALYAKEERYEEAQSVSQEVARTCDQAEDREQILRETKCISMPLAVQRDRREVGQSDELSVGINRAMKKFN